MSELTFGYFLNILQVAVVFLLMITVLVAAHELGHYLFARLFRMGIHEFAIGFGRPKLFTWHRKKTTLDDGSEMETEFNVRAWPLGGFVRIRGMEPQEDGSERQIANGFYSRPAWQRFIVLLAGPVFSVVAGLALLTPIFAVKGVSRETPTVLQLEPTYGAGLAGIRDGDVITSVDGQAVRTANDARVFVRDRTEGPVEVGVTRAGKPLTFKVFPKVDDQPRPVLDARGLPSGEYRRQARLGVRFLPVRVPVGVGEALGESVSMTMLSARSVAAIFTQPKQAKEEVGGVITMVGATNAVVSEGIEQTLSLAAMLSISIGIFNLLPVPPLDGGQMLIAVLEMLRGGRRVSLKFQSALVSIGSIMLLTLFVGVLILDVGRVIQSRSAKPEPAPTLPANAPVNAPNAP